jgi:hypothetical protein
LVDAWKTVALEFITALTDGISELVASATKLVASGVQSIGAFSTDLANQLKPTKTAKTTEEQPAAKEIPKTPVPDVGVVGKLLGSILASTIKKYVRYKYNTMAFNHWKSI